MALEPVRLSDIDLEPSEPSLGIGESLQPVSEQDIDLDTSGFQQVSPDQIELEPTEPTAGRGIEEPKEDPWVTVLAKNVAQATQIIPKTIAEGGHVIREAFGMPESEFRKSVKQTEKILEAHVGKSKAKKWIGQSVRTGGEMVATGFSLPLLSFAAGTSKGGEAIEEGKGVGTALTAGAASAATEFLTEKIPFDILLKPGKSFIKRLGQGLVTDIPGELVATFVEMKGIDEGLLDRKYTDDQLWESLVDTMAVAGITTGGMTTVTHPFIAQERAKNTGVKGVDTTPGNIAKNYVGNLVSSGVTDKATGDVILKQFNERSTPESTPEENVQIMDELINEFASQEEILEGELIEDVVRVRPEGARATPEGEVELEFPERKIAAARPEIEAGRFPEAEVIEDPVVAAENRVKEEVTTVVDSIEPTTEVEQQVKDLLQEELALPEAEIVAPVEVALEPPLTAVAPPVERPPTPEPPIKINIREGVAELDDQNRQILEVIKTEVEVGEAGRRVPVRTKEGEVIGTVAEASTFPEFFQNRGFKKKAVLTALNKSLAGKKLAPGQERNIRELHEQFQRFRPEQIAQLEDIETIKASTLKVGDSFGFEGNTITVRGIGDDGTLTLFDQDNTPVALLPDEEVDIDRGTLKKEEVTPEAPPVEKVAPERVRIGKSPQSHEVIRELEQTPEEKELGERFFEIRNEKTKEVQTVELNEMKPIKKRKKAVFKLGDEAALGDPVYEDVNNAIVNLDVSLDPQLPAYENSAAIREQALRPNQKDRELFKIKREELKKLVAETTKDRGETNVGPVKIYRALYARDFDFGEEGYLSPNPNNPHDTPTGTPVIATWWVADPAQAIAIGGFKTVNKERGPVEVAVMDIDSMPDEVYVTNSTDSGDLSNAWIATPFHTPENNISRHSLTNFEKAYSINFKEDHNANAIKQGKSVSSRELQGSESIYGSGKQQENQSRVEEQARVPKAVKERPTKRPEGLEVPREGRPPRRSLVRKKPAFKIKEAGPRVDKVQLKKDISKTIKSITKGWKNSPPVKIVASTEQLPADLNEDIKFSKAEGKVRGLLDPDTNTIYLISDNIVSTEEAERVFFHEALGHVGIRTLLGNDIKPVLNQVYKKYQAEANDIANTYGFDVGTKEGQQEAAEEVLANIAEENSDPGILKKAYAAIRKWLRKIGFTIELSDNDIRSMMSDASQVVIRPEKSLSVSGPVVFSKKVKPPTKRIVELRKQFGAGPLPQKTTESVYDTSFNQMEDVAEEEADVLKDSPETETYEKNQKGVYKTFVDRVQKTFDKLDPLGDLPEKAAYLTERNLTLGKLAKISDTSKQIYNAFAKATPEQAETIYEYLTNGDIKPTVIKNAQLRADAIEVKNAIIRTGEDLVKRGLLDKQTFMSMKGAYLPRIYLKHLLPEKEFVAMGEGKKPSDMGWSKKRKDIPEDVRRLILGEITDPGYLASKGFGQQQRDMAMLDWLEVVSKNKQWTLDNSLIKWKGQKVTPFWLKNEADRIRRQAKFYVEKDRKEALEISNKMADIADEALQNLPGVPDNFKQIPDTPRYGALRGMVVRSEIFDDIAGASNIHLGDASIAEQILGNGGLATKFTQLWKWSKVAANPPGQIRNFVSNGILLHLSGVPFHKLPLRVIEAVKSIRSNGQAWQVAKKYGITQSTFSSQELVRIERELLDFEARRSGPISLATLKNMGGKIVDLTGDMYQLSESIFKTAKIVDELKKGKSPADAALEAQKWLFDYSLVTPSMRYLRNAPVGVPFLTFYLKALPRMLEVLLTNPLRFAPYAAIPYALTALIANMTDADDDDVDKLRKALPKWLEERGNAYILPAKDAQGRWVAIDVGYFFPWATWTDMAADAGRGEFADVFRGTGIFSGPLPDMITAIKTNVDPFTKKPIINEFDPPEKQIASMMGYLYQMSAPTWLTDIGFAGHMYRALSGTVDKYGEPKTNVTQAALRIAGVNLYPIDPIRTRNDNIRWMNFEISNVKRRRSQLLKDRNFTSEERRSIRNEYKEMIDKRREELRRYKIESKVAPELR